MGFSCLSFMKLLLLTSSSYFILVIVGLSRLIVDAPSAHAHVLSSIHRSLINATIQWEVELTETLGRNTRRSRGRPGMFQDVLQGFEQKVLGRQITSLRLPHPVSTLHHSIHRFGWDHCRGSYKIREEIMRARHSCSS